MAYTSKTVTPKTQISTDGSGYIRAYTTREVTIYPSHSKVNSSVSATRNAWIVSYTKTDYYGAGKDDNTISTTETFFSLKGNNINIEKEERISDY